MKFVKYLIIACSFILLTCNVSAKEYPKVALAGDYGDPTILREGKDYYMTHSAFSNAPGLLIWHSTDLVHWEPICRALPFVPGNVYAPDLVKYDGKYFIYFPAGSNYVIWADKITGPWSKPINLKVNKIDPGHAVGEDGKRYLFLNGGNRVNLTDDGLATDGKPMKIVYTGWDFPAEWKTEGKWLESPKIIKHGEYFYLTSAEGGTAGPPTSHMVISARSKSINGPWENSPYNPIVHTYSADEPWWSKGHGTIIDDVNGNWWIIYHAYKNGFYTLGRFNLVEPIEWTKDGWFKLADKPQKKLVNEVENSWLALSDDFSGNTLGLQWTIWRQRTVDNFQLKNQSLYIDAKGDNPANSRRFVCIPTDTTYRTEVTIQTEEGNSGGLLLSYNDKAFTGIVVSATKIMVYDTAQTCKELPRKSKTPIKLRIDNKSEHCTFSVSDDGKNWQVIADNIIVSGLQHNRYKGFLALKIALTAIGQGQVKFNDFKYTAGVLAPKPCFRDPVYDGAADPNVIWNSIEKKWWMFYTNRRATETQLPGVSWVFKTPIGIAESEDGANWKYVGNANFPNLPATAGGDSATLWAPDIVYGNDGKWHMFLSIQAGIAERWGKVPGSIDHLTSDNLRDWKYISRFNLPKGSYDADVIKMPDGVWRMYYKDPNNHSSTFYYLESRDLKEWSEPKYVMSIQGEGPAVFKWKNYYWMILCDGKGFKTLRSVDAEKWEQQPGGPLMPEGSGSGKDDVATARHGDVVISNGRVYFYYFTHPGQVGEDTNKDGFEQRRSSIQVVELKLKDGWIVANRNNPTFVQLNNPE